MHEVMAREQDMDGGGEMQGNEEERRRNGEDVGVGASGWEIRR